MQPHPPGSSRHSDGSTPVPPSPQPTSSDTWLESAIKAGVEYAVLDIGMQKVQHGGVLCATVAGMTDAGLEIPHGEDVLPDEDRILGKHIDEAIEAAVNTIKEKLEAE